MQLLVVRVISLSKQLATNSKHQYTSVAMVGKSHNGNNDRTKLAMVQQQLLSLAGAL
jgi:hypothetical protein